MLIKDFLLQQQIHLTLILLNLDIHCLCKQCRSRSQEPPHSLVQTSLLTDKEAILKRWAEHFDGVLYRPSSINDEAINRLPQVECNPLLDELPTVSETVKAIKPVIWQGSRIRCNTCRDLQSRRSSSCRETDRVISHYMEKSHPSRIQECNNYPPIQKERESSSL